MRSRFGFAAALAFLLALPLAALSEAVAPGAGGEVAIHLAFSLGSAFLALATPAFRTPRWIARAGAATALFLAVTFLLQGLSTWTGNEGLARLAYQFLGQELETFAGILIYCWCGAVLVTHSRGASRVLGIVSLALAASAPALQVLALAPFVWLLFESRKAPG